MLPTAGGGGGSHSASISTKNSTSGIISEQLVFCHCGISMTFSYRNSFVPTHSRLLIHRCTTQILLWVFIRFSLWLHIISAECSHIDPRPSNLWTLTSLSGHEFPFSIKMSHIRDGGSSGGGLGGGAGRDPTSPTDCPGVLLLDQCLPPDTQCQFILKPSKVILGQAPLMGKTAGPDCGFVWIIPFSWAYLMTFWESRRVFFFRAQVHIFHN